MWTETLHTVPSSIQGLKMTVQTKDTGTPNASNRYEVTQKDLPLQCPLPGTTLWNSHPKVFLPIDTTGKAKCPYCGTEFVLVDRQS